MEKEVEELKKENDNSPEFRSYFSQKESQLKNKEQKLEQLRDIVKSAGSETQTSNSNNGNFPTGWVVGGGIIFVGLFFLVTILIKKKNKDKTLISKHFHYSICFFKFIT